MIIIINIISWCLILQRLMHQGTKEMQVASNKTALSDTLGEECIDCSY